MRESASARLGRQVARAPTPKVRRLLIRRYKAAKLRDSIRDCRQCPLAYTRNRSVPFSGPTPAKLSIIGEAPGYWEDRRGVPFVGKSGALLDEMLTMVGVERSEVMVSNIVRCRPPQNRTPEWVEINACGGWLEAELDLAGSWVVVLMGGTALSVVKGTNRDKASVRRERGKPFWKDGRVWVPTYHPAAALWREERNREIVTHIANDLQLAWDIRRGVGPFGKVVDAGDLQFPERGGHEAAQLREALKKQGWVLVHSNLLDEQIIYVQDEMVEVPEMFSGLVRYTVEEMVRLGLVRERRGMRAQEMVALHTVKAEFGGTVVM